MNKRLLFLTLLLITLPVVILVTEGVQMLLSRAAPVPANIIIDTQNSTGVFSNGSNSFAQGGEEPPPMLAVTASKLKTLFPRYIRLDHIYDYYNIVKKKDNGLEYDFSKLDETVNDIIASGALPFFSLSYMPSAFTSSGKVIDIPSDWNNWKNLVKATVQHYSGRDGKNLNNVYYEVWNEPELPQFGAWKLGGDKDYRLLYYYAVLGAGEARNTNIFFIGGPAVGSYYSNWVNNFLSYVMQNNLRLDFYSWHRYHKSPSIFKEDAQKIRKNLASFPKFAKIPLVLSEWGIESENTPINNSNMAAAFAVSAASQFNNYIDLAFSFEVKDGPPPNGGKWGLFTHEKDTSPLSPKPRFYAFEALSRLKGNKLQLSGGGTYVAGMAVKKDQNIVVIIANYDQANKNTENVPITLTGLSPASYKLKYTYPLEKTSGTYEMTVTSGNLSKSFPLSPNNLLTLEISTEAPLALFMQGKTSQSQDQSLILSNNAPLVLTSPEFRLRPSGSISFDIKPLWNKEEQKSFLIFDAPYSTASGITNRLFLLDQQKPTGNFLIFGIAGSIVELSATVPVDNWTDKNWHHVETVWDINGLSLTVDNLPVSKVESPLDIRNGTTLKFSPLNAALDNLKINLGNEQTIERSFNNRVDK